MCIDQKSRKDSSATPKLRIEPVDNWHTHWQTVLSSIDSAGHRSSLLVDDDGWLSARQVLLVAFHEVDVAGHICFRVLPIADDAGQVIVQAHLDAVGVKPGFESLEIGPALRQAAEHRARALKCTRFIGF